MIWRDEFNVKRHTEKPPVVDRPAKAEESQWHADHHLDEMPHLWRRPVRTEDRPEREAHEQRDDLTDEKIGL